MLKGGIGDFFGKAGSWTDSGFYDGLEKRMQDADAQKTVVRGYIEDVVKSTSDPQILDAVEITQMAMRARTSEDMPLVESARILYNSLIVDRDYPSVSDMESFKALVLRSKEICDEQGVALNEFKPNTFYNTYISYQNREPELDENDGVRL